MSGFLLAPGVTFEWARALWKFANTSGSALWELTPPSRPQHCRVCCCFAVNNEKLRVAFQGPRMATKSQLLTGLCPLSKPCFTISDFSLSEHLCTLCKHSLHQNLFLKGEYVLTWTLIPPNRRTGESQKINKQNAQKRGNQSR